MYIVETATGEKIKVVIEPVADVDFKSITKREFFFDWKKEKEFNVYKISIAGQSEILGLVSLKFNEAEKWVKVNLLAVSAENKGKNKRYESIAGNLIAFACKLAVEHYGEDACVYLDPKSELKQHYIAKYGMYEVANRIFLTNMSLLVLLNRYGYEIE